MKSAVDISVDTMLVIGGFCAFISKLIASIWLLVCAIQWIWHCIKQHNIADTAMMYLPLMAIVIVCAIEYALRDVSRDTCKHVMATEAAVGTK